MRTFSILILLVTAFQSFSQRIALNEIDKFTDNKIYKVDASEGKRWKTSDNIAKGLMNNIFLSTKIIQSAKSKISYSNFNIQLGLNICVNPSNGKIIILFDDNSKMTLNQISAISCDNTLNVEYLISDNVSNINDNLSKLSNMGINSFRIYFSDGYKDFNVKDDKKELIKNHFSFILEEFNKP